MEAATRKPVSCWRLSIIELLLIVGYVAIACTALLDASAIWTSVMLGGIILLVMVLAAIAVFDRGIQQVAAIGGLIALLIYGAAWRYEPNMKLVGSFDSSSNFKLGVEYDNYFPTTYALLFLWDQVNGTYVVDKYSGQVDKRVSDDIPAYETKVKVKDLPIGWDARTTIYRGLPRPEHFMAIGHGLFALLFAYLGGKFAVWVYLRRLTREQAQNP